MADQAEQRALALVASATRTGPPYTDVDDSRRAVGVRLQALRTSYLEDMIELYGMLTARSDVNARPESRFPDCIARDIAFVVHGCDEKLDRIGARLEQLASRKRASCFDGVMRGMILLGIVVGLVVLVHHAFA